MITQQDEVRLKEWFGQLHVLIEGLQKQVSELKSQVAELQKPQSAPVAPAPVKKATVKEEPAVPEVK